MLLPLFGCGPDQGQPGELQAEVDRSEMERVETLSESLANDLLALSVSARERNHEAAAEHFAQSLVATPFPDKAGEWELVTRWIHTHPWAVAASTSELSRDQFMRHWRLFFGHFSEVEDVRFKVKRAEFDAAGNGKARLFLYVIGRDLDQRREWVRSWISAEASPAGEESWHLTRFAIESLESTTSSVDLFSEVAAPAGVALELPPFGKPGNNGFVWHGAAAADVDNDGDIDLFVTAVDRNRLYLNSGGDFEERAEELGVAHLPESSVAPLFFDMDNDGDQDLFLTAVGRQMLLQNRLVEDGRLAFADISVGSGVDVPAVGFSATAADVTGDGLPELYVSSYNRYGQVMPNSWDRATNGTKNRFFVNQGNGRFLEQAAQYGLDDSRWSYAAQFADVDDDGDLDLYVANDFGENAYFEHQGDTFSDRAEELGISDAGNGMGVSFGDYDNDGDLDLHVTNMSSTAGNRILSRLYPEQDKTGGILRKLAAGSSLYERLDDGSFENVTAKAGGFSGGWSWGGGFIDFDNDGWEDTFTPNGFVSGASMKDT